LRVTDAVLVRRTGGGEVVAVGDGAGELETVLTPAAGVGVGDPASDPITPKTTKTPMTAMIAVHTLWRAGQFLWGG
jgi:hypothetical protein